MPETIAIAIIEDHVMVREALAGLLERIPRFKVTGKAGTVNLFGSPTPSRPAPEDRSSRGQRAVPGALPVGGR